MNRLRRTFTFLNLLALAGGLGAGAGFLVTTGGPLPQSRENSHAQVEPRISDDSRQLSAETREPDGTALDEVEQSSPARDRLATMSLDDDLASTQAVANALMLGDMLLTNGDAAAALRQYRLIWDRGNEVSVTPDVRYRLAMCAEALGDSVEALTGYQFVTDETDDGNLKERALLGQARVLDHQGNVSAAQQMLVRWVLSGKAARRQSPQVAHHALFLLGEIAAIQVLDERSLPLWEEGSVSRPQRAFASSQYLHDEAQDVEGSTEPSPVGIHIVHQLAEAMPEAVLLDGRVAQTTVQRAVDAICQQTSWRVEWSQLAETVLQAQTVSLDFQEQPADFILDWLLAPFGATWRYDTDRLSIIAESELDDIELQQHRRQRAERILLAALVEDPKHDQSPVAYVLLGNLAFQHSKELATPEPEQVDPGLVAGDNAENARNSRLSGDKLQVAQKRYEHVLQSYPRSSVLAEAWFNLAKVSLVENDLPGAQRALFGAIDAGRGHPLEPLALLLAGRTALTLDEPQTATRSLLQATRISGDREVRALSLLSLAAAHLLSGRPDIANVALMEDRELLQSDTHRDRAAFLASLARFHAASTPGRLNHEGQSLVTAISRLGTLSHSDLPEIYLMVDACKAVGLSEVAIPIIEQTITHAPPSPLRDHLHAEYIQLLIQRGEFEQAEQQLALLATPTGQDRFVDIRLQLIRLAVVQDHTDRAESHCRDLLEYDLAPRERKDVLHLLGTVYARRGDHQRAALCLSGIVPAETSGSSPQSREVSRPQPRGEIGR